MKSRHSAAHRFIASGLFDGLNSFAEIEARISAQPGNKERGDAFEVFAEAYLATQKINEAREVWPFEAVPLEQRKLLSLDTGRDMGVDGTYQTHDGELRAYQVKFRSNRPALTWDELSTFMGLTDQVSQRVLFTNCETLPGLMRDRSGFIAIRGSDLDRLTPEDFEVMRLWLQSGQIKLSRKQPLPHQAEALAAIASELNDNDRATVVMACGTGKSLVALWAAEQRGCRNILVLLPSLALVRQLLHEWLRETSWDALTFQCVCSDPTVAKDADDLIVHQADLDFPVTTASSAIRNFLTKPFDGVKVIFSTYQSAHVVAEGMPVDVDGIKIPFDFGVFDEAHKTAGREGRNYGFALDDIRLPIRKRMFLTATPRHYNPHQRDKEGEAQIAYSMDNPEVYGKQAYVITFGEAARRGIICNYKVIISVITSEMVTDELLSRGDVLINGDAVRARQVANQIALCDAVEKYGVKKIFTFHKTVKSAASFVSDGNEGIRTHLVEFKSYHVNGEMPTARRDRVMDEFRKANQAVMSNARCLTEGVDVPAVDMVAFLSPRRSRVDIVQATGRAMRRADGKSMGYVLVPLYVEVAAGESVETAVSRAEFDEVWDVLQSLQEQDEVLAEFIRYAGEQKGHGKGFDDRGYADRIDFVGACISLANLRTAVATRCVEKLVSSWDSWFGKLQDFKERFGHCNVDVGWKEDRSLSSWVSAQRTRRGKGALTEDKILRLDNLGFVWNMQDSAWSEWFEKLLEFKQRYGHCNVVKGEDEWDDLAAWVSTLRVRKNSGGLPEDRIERLNEVGFIWDYQQQKTDETWMKWYRELEKYAHENGNPHVPRTHSNTKLASWVWIQRVRRERDYSGKQLMAEQVELLDKLGFHWDAQDGKWLAQFEKLKAFKIKFGHCNVEFERDSYAPLFSWLTIQRAYKREGQLQSEREAMLNELGVEWESGIRDTKWQAQYEQLKKYHLEIGNSDVPNRSTEYPQLASWVGSQRELRKKNALTDEQVGLLDKIGFAWKLRERGSWEDRLAEVVEFKAKHGHCDIPMSLAEPPKLAAFVNATRVQKNKGTLSAERVAKLNAVGFMWEGKGTKIGEDGMNEAWKKRFDELLQYKQVHGDCNVPTGRYEKAQLQNWVNQQRTLKRNGTLHAERVRLLDDAGFKWEGKGTKVGEDGINEVWKEYFDEMLQYKLAHGNCRVPTHWAENPQLGGWVVRQRQLKKNGKLQLDRECLLDEAGFEWSAKK
ncbi:MAG: Helicase associated domain protein [Gallionella sp.]|jgi:superfamily II DNA or RNA helicase